MRFVNFEVPPEVLADFVREMEEREIEALIIGVNDDEEIELRIDYAKDEAEKIDELEEKLDELTDSFYSEEEEGNDDENENRPHRK